MKGQNRKEAKMSIAWRWILLSVHILNVVFSDQILPTHTGATYIQSSREPKYQIEFHSEDSPFHPDHDQESTVMLNKNGEKFLCYLPKVEKSKSGKPVNQQNRSSLILETERQIKLKTPDELLEVFKDLCFLRQEGWWAYEFCYQKKLRQIHVENEKVVQEYVLGVFDSEATAAYHQNLSDISVLKDPRSKDASQRYHAHQYTNGTICDLTNQPRETEVRFVCSEPRAMISSITEISTCKYALTIQSPMLCRHPLFQDEKPSWQRIDCNVLPKDDKEENVEEVNFQVQDSKIAMITDLENPSNFDSDEHAT